MKLDFFAGNESWRIACDTARAPRTLRSLASTLPAPLQLHTPKIAGQHIYWHAPFVEDAEVAPLHFFGGVTADWIVMQVGYWFKTVRGERRAARQATETPRVRTATLIH